MQSAFIATCPNSNEAVIVVLGVTTVSEFRAAAAAQGLIRTCDDEEGYEFYKPLQAWAVLTPEGTWDLGASSDAPDALPAMVATARWVSITSCQCEACPVNEGTHKPAGALLQIDEPKSSVNQVDEAINSLLRAALIEGGCSAERVIEAREETNLRRAELRTLLSTPQPCSRSHPHEEMTPMCELRTEIARLTNALARAEAQLAAAPQAVQPFGWLITKSKLPGDVEFTQDPVRENLARSFGYQTQALYTHSTQQGIDAQRWQIVRQHISAEYIAGRACFVVHVQPMSGANIMRGSVAEHFTKAVDDRAKQIKIAHQAWLAAQAKQGAQP